MSNRPFQHGMTPAQNHDEVAREDAVRTMRFHLYAQVSQGTRAYYTNVVAPEFAKTEGRALKDRAEIRRVMENKTYVKFHLSLQRSVQEIMWNTVVENIERQLPEMNDRAKALGSRQGSLSLDPSLTVPRYVANVDIHCMPGGYGNDASMTDSVAAGAIYDRGTSMYGRGSEGFLGQSVIAYLKKSFPGRDWSRILDMGCTIGLSTVRYAEAFPDAALCAIDVAGPCLRYGHARAESLGRAVHYSQQNAERTSYADGSFDLVVSTILAHETSTAAWRNILKESHRLLKPGGVMVHADLPQFADIDVYSQFLFGNETKYNNEPFWSTFRAMDLKQAMIDAGFATDKCFLDVADHADTAQGMTNARMANAGSPGKSQTGFGWGVQVGIK